MKIFYVYIVQCRDDSFYIGVTSNLTKRLIEHNSGFYPSAYTYKRRPVILKWFEQFTDAAIAFQTEKQLKGWSRRKKIALIEENWYKVVKYSKNYSEYGKNDDSLKDRES